MSIAIDSNLCLDETDWHLIEALQADARLSFTALGHAVGLSRPAVAERFRLPRLHPVLPGQPVRDVRPEDQREQRKRGQDVPGPLAAGQ